MPLSTNPVILTGDKHRILGNTKPMPKTTKQQIKDAINKIDSIDRRIEKLKESKEPYQNQIKEYLDSKGLTEIEFPTGEKAMFIYPTNTTFDYSAMDTLLRERITRGALRGTLRERLLAKAFNKLTQSDVNKVIKEVSAEVGKPSLLTPSQLKVAMVKSKGSRRFKSEVAE